MLPATHEFFTEIYSTLSKEGQRRVDAFFEEWGIGNRDLTQKEVEEGVKILVGIVKIYQKVEKQ